ASVHVGHHQREIVNWVHDNLFELARRPNAFLSVSLTAAEDDEESQDSARQLIEDFERDTNWYPRRSEPIAGALQYREYNPFARTLMRLMLKKDGHPTDSSHDYDYTDWEGVSRLGEELAGDFRAALASEPGEWSAG
ncbi:MAG: flavodoxin domain-containing protein, partial [Solirubrobacterales bacterium]